MKTIFATLVAASIGLTASAQSTDTNLVNHQVAEKGPVLEFVEEICRDKATQQGTLFVTFRADSYPLYIVTGLDTLAKVENRELSSIEFKAPYILKADHSRQYAVHVVSANGSKTFIGNSYSRPPACEQTTE